MFGVNSGDLLLHGLHGFHCVCFFSGSSSSLSFIFHQAYSVDGNPLKLEDEFRHPRHSAVLAAARASLAPATPRRGAMSEVQEPTPRLGDGQPVAHRQGQDPGPKSSGIPGDPS